MANPSPARRFAAPVPPMSPRPGSPSRNPSAGGASSVSSVSSLSRASSISSVDIFIPPPASGGTPSANATSSSWWQALWHGIVGLGEALHNFGSWLAGAIASGYRQTLGRLFSKAGQRVSTASSAAKAKLILFRYQKKITELQDQFARKSKNLDQVREHIAQWPAEAKTQFWAEWNAANATNEDYVNAEMKNLRAKSARKKQAEDAKKKAKGA